MALEKRDGSWLIVHEHTSAKRRPAPTPKPEDKWQAASGIAGQVTDG